MSRKLIINLSNEVSDIMIDAVQKTIKKHGYPDFKILTKLMKKISKGDLDFSDITVREDMTVVGMVLGLLEGLTTPDTGAVDTPKFVI